MADVTECGIAGAGGASVVRAIEDQCPGLMQRLGDNPTTNDVPRCEVTRNECGTDTWAEGHSCSCRMCQAYLLGLRAKPFADDTAEAAWCAWRDSARVQRWFRIHPTERVDLEAKLKATFVAGVTTGQDMAFVKASRPHIAKIMQTEGFDG